MNCACNGPAANNGCPVAADACICEGVIGPEIEIIESI